VRSLALARPAWIATSVLWIAATAATAWVQPGVFANLTARPWILAFVALSVGGAWGAFVFPRRGRELAAFVSSSMFLFGLVTTALASNYPNWLRSTVDPALSLTATNSSSASHALRTALLWWGVGITLAVGYFTILFRMMRRKVEIDPDPAS
jgi:cytochrome d ubiquinol oxidase subunit II